MFELQHVTKSFFSTSCNKVQVLQDFSYTFELNKSYVITGSSGSGKTTLLNLMMGIDAPSSGKIFFQQQDITYIAHYNRTVYEQFLLRSLGVVFQQPLLVPELNFIDTLGFKGLLLGMVRADIITRVEQLAELLGLSSCLQQPVAFLSGGQQQRVALGRALFIEPQFLLIDEPTAHLDAITAQEIVQLLREIQGKTGCGLIVTSHDPLVMESMDVRIDLKNLMNPSRFSIYNDSLCSEFNLK